MNILLLIKIGDDIKKQFLKNKRKFENSKILKKTINPQRRLLREVHKYCISFWIASSTKGIMTQKSSLGSLSLDLLLGNPKEVRSGTLTIVKTNNQYYGITCKHVIDIFDKKNSDAKIEFSQNNSLNIEDLENFKPYALFTQNKKQFDLSENVFFQPSSQYPDPTPDIVITKLSENLIKNMNKKAIDLDKNDVVPNNLSFGIAVGYPENLKSRRTIGDNSYITMPHCIVVAELDATPRQRFTLCSTVKDIVDRNFSGMSGGPILWNQSTKFNLLGIIYESPNSQYDVFNQNDIVISGELAIPHIVKGWIEELFDNNIL